MCDEGIAARISIAVDAKAPRGMDSGAWSLREVRIKREPSGAPQRPGAARYAQRLEPSKGAPGSGIEEVPRSLQGMREEIPSV